MTLGEIIRQARERLGWSQARLAKEVGVSRATVGQWEADLTGPKRKRAPAVARALGIPLGAVDSRSAQTVVPVDTTTLGRTIPVIPWEGLMRPRREGVRERFSVDGDTPDDAVAMRVVDDSMAPDIMAGEMIIVSPGTPPQVNDVVVAVAGDSGQLLRRYVPRGRDRQGNEVFDLLSTSPDWPTVTCNTVNKGKVLATVISHVRRLRRP